jgi:hypothetical protein
LHKIIGHNSYLYTVKEIKRYQKSGYNTYRGWIQIEYQNKCYNINQNGEGTEEDRERDGGINFILRMEEQKTRLILLEHDDDDNNNKFIPTGWNSRYTKYHKCM